MQHAKVLSEVPAIAMQFANDAEWIGDEVERSKLKLGTQLDSKAAAELDGGIKRLRAMAAEQREVQVVRPESLSDRADPRRRLCRMLR